MTRLEQILTILLAGFATLLTRFIPFVIFKGKKIPKALDYLGFALPEIFGLALTTLIYLWKKNTLISIAAGTVFYMFLVQVVF